MKIIVTSLLIIVFSNVNAGMTDQEITKICLQQAVSLVNQLKSDIFTDMDKSQSDDVLRLATRNCNKYFNTKNLNQVKVNTTAGNHGDTTADNEDESGDWFTKYILNGEVPDKEGNRRLKSMQHK